MGVFRILIIIVFPYYSIPQLVFSEIVIVLVVMGVYHTFN